MLAPPASFATSRRRSAPSAVRRSIRNGTAVSGNLAGLVASRARLLEGSSTWAMAPACAWGSCSMIATQDPSPSVTITPLLQHEPLSRRSEQGLHLAEHQDPAGGERVRERFEQPLLQRPIEIDHDVAAHDEVVRGRRGRLAGEIVLVHAHD